MKECLMNKYTYSISNENKEACKAGQLIQAAKLPTKKRPTPLQTTQHYSYWNTTEQTTLNKLRHHTKRPGNIICDKTIPKTAQPNNSIKQAPSKESSTCSTGFNTILNSSIWILQGFQFYPSHQQQYSSGFVLLITSYNYESFHSFPSKHDRQMLSQANFHTICALNQYPSTY